MIRLNRHFLLIFALLSLTLVAQADTGLVKIFNGKDLSGWTVVGGDAASFPIQNGELTFTATGTGNLYTEKEYSDFILRCEFKTEKDGNNGIGIRTPLQGDAAYMGMELQILDDSAPMYANLEPGQYCCSIYKVVPAKRGALKPAGQWNTEEVRAIGRHITITLNGKKVVDADLNSITDPHILSEHPGMLRDKGHIGFLGHGPSSVWIRNIYLKDLSKMEKDNTPPPGFTALFNGKNLQGWKGLVSDPPHRALMTVEQLAEAQKKADAGAFAHWKAVGGVITYDGKDNSLCTVKDYRDFEMLVDWKIEPGGDSGIYLRGSPQIQIWDNPLGSGGLYNNQKNPSNPTVVADNPTTQWNRFRILMVNEHVTVFLNNQLVVNNVLMENYWERDKPIYRTGQIELQHHNSPLGFKNIYIRDLNTP